MNWPIVGGFKKCEQGIGSYLPTLRLIYDIPTVLRALFKIAVNLLSYCCPNTPVNRTHFGDVVRVVKGEAPVTASLIQGNGFIWASDTEPFRATGDAHSFRIIHAGRMWRVYFSFFGGRVGAFVRFPGPKRESWRFADVVMPLRSSDVTVQVSHLEPRLPRVHIEWGDLSKIIPSAELINTTAEIGGERR